MKIEVELDEEDLTDAEARQALFYKVMGKALNENAEGLAKLKHMEKEEEDVKEASE